MVVFLSGDKAGLGEKSLTIPEKRPGEDDVVSYSLNSTRRRESDGVIWRWEWDGKVH